jgi:hypothetical protein
MRRTESFARTGRLAKKKDDVASLNVDGYMTWTNEMFADVDRLHVKRNKLVGMNYLVI